ncbi:FAD-dependent oxidoreductase [Rhodococcus fascians]|uniref:oxidoreductase n=1 Tax=Rhodococcoides fascians TaxID=1828 RepID=UPI00196136FA|nr:FAD-dependent oxidoreductase [Rhodococcus fascians]MBM7244224.1 FAD-dependent oxidoreductase [Rhodococcus fascians]MBY3810420.1 FAD-dependent oxidoreductase [Rhodococcus fascians]MBY3841957.1 FAD-dependent oxidoreductase [Rhodococcus fascians]MBY3844408.1 FAD-dependent oxidoreductase [Rhodococcus fascians]MBY3850354.1 FAD-dependent oxidoreductase [Rhodococcus fascians]
MIDTWTDGLRLPLLMSPTRIGSRVVKNRIVSPPHGTYFAAGGLVTDQQVDYYAERAAGGVGMIVVGNMSAWSRSKTGGGQNYAFSPDAVDGHRRLADAVHEHGTLLLAQLWDGGRQGSSRASHLPLLSSSPLPDTVVREIPKQIEESEIADMISSFARSAALLEQAGWDGIELLAAQGYGLAQFLSPQMNHRQDRWGGTPENRVRVVTEIVSSIRSVVTKDFLVGVRINGDDMIAGGNTPDDAVATALLLEATGGVDYLNVSGASNENYPLWIADMGHDTAMFVDAARKIKDEVSIPVMVATRIKDPLIAESVLAEGSTDLVGMNRALIADPTMPNKIESGHLSQVRPCISCNQGCVGKTAAGGQMECTVNPRVGFEGTTIQGRVGRQSVAVVGGGPAGMQAAVVSAERGADVVLFESRDLLGGQIELASRAASRAEFGLLVEHLKRRLAALDVDVRLGVSATVADLDPFDHIFLATGSIPWRTGFSTHRPDVHAIPGHDLPHVFTAVDAFERVQHIGHRVLIAEDEFQGHATTAAEFLAQNGHTVTLVSRSTSVGVWSGASQEFLYKRLRRAGVELRAHTWLDAIGERSVQAYDVFSGQTVDLGDFDSVVLATGSSVDDRLYNALGSDDRVVRIGDCLAPRRLDNAMWDGLHASDNLSIVGTALTVVPS